MISLEPGYGLGDAVQMSAVLQHVAKYRSDWSFDFQAEEGKHQVGRGIAAHTFTYGEPYPPSRQVSGIRCYDSAVRLLLFDTWFGWSDRPNTRVTSVLRDRLLIEDWDPECGRYHVQVSKQVMDMSKILVNPSRGSGKSSTGGAKVVAVHYQGRSDAANKDLSHDQAAGVCRKIESLGCTPLLVDWEDLSPLPDECGVRTVGRISPSREWGADAEVNCALISQCAAFVGVDSGPAHCAGATSTPSLVVWTGHHPAPFYDPAPNVTHMVPQGFHDMVPVCGDPDVVKWFDAHYRVRTYLRDLVSEISGWLEEVLCEGLGKEGVRDFI